MAGHGEDNSKDTRVGIRIAADPEGFYCAIKAVIRHYLE